MFSLKYSAHFPETDEIISCDDFQTLYHAAIRHLMWNDADTKICKIYRAGANWNSNLIFELWSGLYPDYTMVTRIDDNGTYQKHYFVRQRTWKEGVDY